MHILLYTDYKYRMHAQNYSHAYILHPFSPPQPQSSLTFAQNPSKYSALLAYMSSTIHNSKWDICTVWYIVAEGRYRLWGFDEQLGNNNIVSVAEKVEEINFSMFVCKC